jgi:predicted O-methyltransferase YrrM
MRSSNDIIAQYVESLNAPRSKELLAIAERLKKDGKWGINIGAVEAAILQFLIKSHGVKNILEIGTQYGYSTQWMLEALPSDGTIVSLEKDPDHHQVAKTLITDERVTFLLGDAEVTLNQLNSKAFDLIFIDANKKSYPELKRMFAPGDLLSATILFYLGKFTSPSLSMHKKKVYGEPCASLMSVCSKILTLSLV